MQFYVVRKLKGFRRLKFKAPAGKIIILPGLGWLGKSELSEHIAAIREKNKMEIPTDEVERQIEKQDRQEMDVGR